MVIRICTPLLIGIVAVAAWAAVSARAASIGDRLDQAQEDLRANQGRGRLLTTEVQQLDARLRSTADEFAAARARLADAERRLGVAQAELAARQRQLRAERARLVRLRVRLLASQRVLSERLVSLYKSDEPDLLAVALNADGFRQLLDDAAFINRVGAQDRRIVTAVREARAESERQAQRLGRLEKQQQKVTDGLAARRDVVAADEAKVAEVRSRLAAARGARSRRLATTRRRGRQLQDRVEDLQAAQSRVERQLLSAQAGSSVPAGPVSRGAGGWVWPINGTITSPFCEARSWEACHPGLDISAPSGTPIRAAKSGRVVLMQSEASSGGYGNYTCVQHDATTSSCYAHQTRFGTSQGASVSTGQVIGYVGSTGRSTGPHLHFEVRVNGGVVNPLGYL